MTDTRPQEAATLPSPAVLIFMANDVMDRHWPVLRSFIHKGWLDNHVFEPVKVWPPIHETPWTFDTRRCRLCNGIMVDLVMKNTPRWSVMNFCDPCTAKIMALSEKRIAEQAC